MVGGCSGRVRNLVRPQVHYQCAQTLATLIVSTQCMVAVSSEMAPAPRAHEATDEADRPAKRFKQGTSIDFDQHLSEEGRLRLYPSLRKIVCQFAGSDNVIPMHGGLPPAHSFPVSSVQLNLANGQRVEVTDAQKV